MVFAAGMSLVDTTDGVLMLGAYGWAYMKPIRKLYYNLNITLVSVIIAFVIGGIEALSVVGGELGLRGGIWTVANRLDFGLIGVAIVGIFVVSWLLSTLFYRWKRYDELPVRRERAEALDAGLPPHRRGGEPAGIRTQDTRVKSPLL